MHATPLTGRPLDELPRVGPADGRHGAVGVIRIGGGTASVGLPGRPVSFYEIDAEAPKWAHDGTKR
jgi:hypothetical protein